MGFDIAVPDFSTLSRRSKGLALPSAKPGARTSGSVHLVVDSTGLKVFGEGEWLENKHKAKRNRKRWRKLHLGPSALLGHGYTVGISVGDLRCRVPSISSGSRKLPSDRPDLAGLPYGFRGI